MPEARDLTPYSKLQARIYAVPRRTPDQILVGLNDRDQRLHDVYRLDLRTAERQLVFRNAHNVAGWVPDLEGKLRLGTRVRSDGCTEILRVEGAPLSAATAITAPLLVVRGANDPRVKKAESHQIVVALRGTPILRTVQRTTWDPRPETAFRGRRRRENASTLTAQGVDACRQHRRPTPGRSRRCGCSTR